MSQEVGGTVGSVATRDRNTQRNGTLVYSLVNSTVAGLSLLLGSGLPNTGSSRGLVSSSNASVLVRSTGLRLVSTTVLTFDGVFGSVTVGQPLRFNWFSMTIVLQQASNNAQGYVFSTSTPNGVDYKYFSMLSSTTFLRIYYVSVSSPLVQQLVDMPPLPRDGQFHQILLNVFNGTLTVFVDNTLQLTLAMGGLYVPAQPFFVGKRAPTAILFSGQIADFRFFPNMTLTKWPPQSLNYFAISSTTGVLTLVNRIDAALISFFALTVSIRDSRSALAPLVVPVTVNVVDTNDNAPLFSQDTYSISVLKNTTIGTTLLSFSVVDADVGSNAVFTLSITGGDTTYFAINGTRLVLRAWLDAFPQPGVYSLSVTARDNGVPAISSVAQVTVTIVSVPLLPPRFNNVLTATAASGLEPVTLLATIAATVSPWEATAATVFYTLSPPLNYLALDWASGMLTLQSHFPYDLGQVVFNVTATALNDQNLSSTLPFTLSILYSQPIVLNASNIVSVQEGPPPATPLLLLGGVDVDGSRNNQNLRYTLLDGDSRQQFALNAYSGLLSTAPSCAGTPNSFYSLF